MILFATYSSAWGGAGQLLLDWAGAMAEDTCLAAPPGPLADRMAGAGARVFPLTGGPLEARGGPVPGARAAFSLAQHAAEIRRLVRDLEPEVLVAWGMRSAIACWAGPQLPAPWVFQHNDLLPSPPASGLVRAAAARAQLVTVPSRFVAADLDPRSALADRLAVVAPGVDLGRFPVAPPPDGPPIVVVLGALVSWKRPGLALEACALARRSHPELQVRFVGAPLGRDGERLLETLRRRAAQPDLAGAVTFVGSVSQPEVELTRSTCLLHAADREPFGLAVVEAMAAARPVVIPDAGGAREVTDPGCAVRYSPGDSAAAAQAIVSLLEDPGLARRLGQAGRGRALELFSADASRAAWRRALERPRHSAEHSAPSPGRRHPAAADREISIVTVTHNSRETVTRLLASVDRHLPGASVVVVDCASGDGTAELVRGWSRARLIALPENVGFGRGCNLGLAEVRTPVTALLNPDVELLDRSLLELAALAQSPWGAARLLAPLLLRPDGRRENTAHARPASAAELLRALLPSTLLPARLALALEPWRATRPRRVAWAVGAALVARTQTLGELGPFDESIFLYGEDLELCLRAAEHGVETWFCPSCRLVHRGGHSSAQAFGGEPVELLARARRDAVRRRLGWRRAVVDDALQAATFTSRIMARAALGRDSRRQRRQLRAVRQARRGPPAGPGTAREL